MYKIVMNIENKDEYLITIFLANFVRYKVCYYRQRLADILLIIYKNQSKTPEEICDLMVREGIYKSKQCGRNTLGFMRKLNIVEKDHREHIKIHPNFLYINFKS